MEGARRTHVAVLSADLVGLSRLRRDDERATLDTLAAYRELIGRAVERHDGRVAETPGEALLARFASPVEAVVCAAEVQRTLDRRNRALAEDRRLRFRIGVDLGEVIETDGALTGEGVNLAARLGGLAEGGGICISGPLHDQVAGKVDLGFESLGERDVTTVPKPVRAYRVLLEPAAQPQTEARPARRRSPLRIALFAGGALAVLAAFAALGSLAWRASQDTALQRLVEPAPAAAPSLAPIDPVPEGEPAVPVGAAPP